MKTFGKIILGLLVAFIGITMFNYANSYAVHKDVGEQGDAAYVSNDLAFFKQRFEYYKNTPLLEEHVEFIVETEDENRNTISFDFYIFHSANTKESRSNFLTVLVKDLETPEDIKVSQLLDVYFEYSVYKPKENESFGVVRIGKENWYLQWIGMTQDDILSVKLMHGDLLLYEYDKEEPLLKAEDHDLIHLIEGKDASYGVVSQISKDAHDDVGVPEREPTTDEAVLYEVEFFYRLAKDVEVEGNLYLSGEFNNWDKKNEKYKLTKNSDGVYETMININSEYENVYYTIYTEDGSVATDGNNKVEYFVYDFVKKDNNDLADYDIYQAEQVNFNKYSHYKWIVIGIYFGVIVLVGVLLALFRKSKQPRAVYSQGPNNNKPENNQQKTLTSEENSTEEL